MSANEETALILAARGIAVFPCFGKDVKPPLKPKAPLTEDGFYNATTDQAQIKRWWKSYPDALIGVPYEQLGAVGVDIDCHPGKPDGRPVWKEFVKRHSGGIEPDYGFGQNTLSGGTLMLFKRPEGLRIPGSLAPGIDLKTSGYFCTGEGYKPHQSHGFDRPLPLPPSWLVSLIDDLTPKAAPQEERAQLPPGDTDTSAGNLVSAALRDWIKQEGGRNKAGYKLACQLRDLRLSEGEAERFMIQYRAECHPHEGHEYTEKEMLESLRSAYNGTPREKPQGKNPPKAPRSSSKAQGAETPRNGATAPQARDFQPAADPQEPEFDQAPGTTEAPQGARPARKTRWTPAELIDTDLPPVRWFVPDLIPAGMIFLGGRPKVGKSWLALQLAVAVSTGGKFLDKQVPQGSVLYMALEDSETRLKDRTQKMNIPRTAAIEFEQNWKPLHEGGLDDLLIEIERNNPQLIIMDTFLRVTRGLKDEADKVSPITDRLQRMAIERQILILIVDHTRKPSGIFADPIDDLIGSTAKAANADGVMVLYKAQGKPGAVLKSRAKETGDIEIPVSFDVNTWCWQAQSPDIELTDRRAEILSTLEDIGSSTAQKIATLLGQDYSNTRKRLQDLALAGKVKIVHKDGKTYYEYI